MNQSKGQSLIEVIIGVGIAVLLAVSLITTSLVTQRTARSARNNTQASKLVQESIEEVRAMRDRKGYRASLINTDVPNECQHIFKDSSSDPKNWSIQVYTPEGSKPGEPKTLNNVIYYRCMNIQSNQGGKLVTVTVTWNETTEEKQISSQTLLTNWNDLP